MHWPPLQAPGETKVRSAVASRQVDGGGDTQLLPAQVFPPQAPLMQPSGHSTTVLEYEQLPAVHRPLALKTRRCFVSLQSVAGGASQNVPAQGSPVQAPSTQLTAHATLTGLYPHPFSGVHRPLVGKASSVRASRQ